MGDANGGYCSLPVEHVLSSLPPDMQLLVFRALLSWLPVAALSSKLWLTNGADATGHGEPPAIVPSV